ncbi:hypothetical protein [Pseudonocardia sp. ICBG601]|nr:hypothetical protein [Pseudonocardia sp. ICBG601]
MHPAPGRRRRPRAERSAQRAMLALPPVEDAVGVLEGLAARRVPALVP